jgi:DNA modification methylase
MESPWLMQGDCLDRMKEIPDGSVDAIITDPPYPCIKRKYGYWTEEQWHLMMRGVVAESRRILKPHGSAVFILQPNSEKVGRMRPWLWEFMAWTAREWNQVQDMWWWNYGTPPTTHCNRKYGLARPSLKAAVWLGSLDCFRNQDEVLWDESDSQKASRLSDRATNNLIKTTNGMTFRKKRMIAVSEERGGVTPLNVLPWVPISTSGNYSGKHGHGAGTPSYIANWWIRYISNPSDLVCDPFMGAGTIPLESLKMGRKSIGIEKYPEYFDISRERITDHQAGITRKPVRKSKTGTQVPLQKGLFDDQETG